VAIEQRIANQSPQSLARAAGREQENFQALQSFKEQKFPVKENLFQPAIRREVYTKSKILEKDLEKTQAQIENLASKYQYQDNALIGARLRVLRDTAAKQTKAVASSKYEESYKLFDKAGFKEDMADVGGLVDGIVKDSGNTFQIMPQVFQRIIQKYSKGGKEVEQFTEKFGFKVPLLNVAKDKVPDASFKELHSLYKRANARSLFNSCETKWMVS